MTLLCSLLTFAAGGYFVKNVTSRQTLVFTKITSSFFQTCQLTTLVKIDWPAFALFTIPFIIPFNDARCISDGFGLTQLHFFFAIIYLPILAFGLLYQRIQSASIVHKSELMEIFTFLVLLS